MKKHRQGTKPEEVPLLVDVSTIARGNEKVNRFSTGSF